MLNRRIVVAALAALFCTTITREAFATPFQSGDFITYSQDNWGTLNTTASQLLVNHFDALYPGGVEIGVIGAPGFSVIFTSASAVLDFLPTGSDFGFLSNDYQDPTSFGNGEGTTGLLLALTFNVDFNDAGLLTGTAGTLFGDLVLHDIASPYPSGMNGLTVREFLTFANVRLGIPSEPFDIETTDVAALAYDLARAFESGTPTQFAQDHLQVAAQPVPEPATLTLLGVGIAALKIGRSRRNRYDPFSVCQWFWLYPVHRQRAAKHAGRDRTTMTTADLTA